MKFADKSRWVSVSCSLALLTMVGCKSSPPPKEVTFPQTSEKIVVDRAHPPEAAATVDRVYEDPLFGKTEVRSDNYIRHADSVSPSGWTPWHYRTAKHDWTPPVTTYETTVSGSWTARVQAVDPSSRTITLMGPTDRSETFEVGSTVQRLDEVSVGDNLTLTWTATLHGELRKPTAQEAADPIKVYSMVDRGSSDAAPSGSVGSVLRVVTTIDAVDPAAMTVTLKGPLGNRINVRGKSKENIQKLQLGDTIVVMYSQGKVLSLNKSP